MTDMPPVRDRFDTRTTTILDALSVLLLAGAAGWGAWVLWHPAWGLLAAGVVVRIAAAAADRAQNPRPPKRAKVPPGAHPHREFLPGPEDAGTLHVKGR